MEYKISRDALIQDIRELSNLLEDAHPDPYVNGGGKIAYNRRLQKLIIDIPFDGMTKQEFFFHLQPFLAMIGDGHTGVIADKSSLDSQNPGGLPFFFEPLTEGKLYVKAVTSKEYSHLIGCILVSVEGVAFKELVLRQSKLIGSENDYNLLGLLGKDGSLYYKHYLKRLIPEWKNNQSISVVLRHPNGKEETYAFPPSANVSYPLFDRNTTFDLPTSKNPFFSFYFIGSNQGHNKNIALMQIDNMMTYREAFEYWERSESTPPWFINHAKRVFKIFNDQEPPTDIAQVIRGIPAITEMFIELFQEMKNRRSEVLVIDLQNNSGGNDNMISILLYFLLGFDKTVSLIMSNATVRKMSKHLSKTSGKGVELETIFYANLIPLMTDDYDFSRDSNFIPDKLRQITVTELIRAFEMMPSFYKEFKSGEFEGYYLPIRIYVICSSQTFSSGFNLMTYLHRIGANIVGTPSSQAGNSFGDNRTFELNNSKLLISYSTKYFVAFPDDPEKGCLLMPNYPITYEKLASYNFDKNASMLYTLEIVNSCGGSKPTEPIFNA